MDAEMTFEEIEARFDAGWVLVGVPRSSEALEVLGGKVPHHARDRDEVYGRAVALRPERCAVLYTGEIPEDTVVALLASASSPHGPHHRAGRVVRPLRGE